jgi:MFS family permease
VARGLGYAGMYGIIFFLTQFLQDIQRHSSLITGIGFLPTPAAVFLASQLTSRVLVNRYPAKVLMIMGTTSSALGLLLATQLHANTSYLQILVSLLLIGTGMGISFVSLTTAGLAGVAPSDAGAASGLINVMQQLGAALGLAVLVTVFDSVTPGARSAGLNTAAQAGAAARTALVHGIDVTMAAGTGFALLALAIVVVLVRAPARTPVSEPADVELEPAAA